MGSRNVLRRVRHRLTRAVPGRVPPILVLSVPKSGTNFLSAALQFLTRETAYRPRRHVRSVRPDGSKRPERELIAEIRGMRGGDILTTHIAHGEKELAAVRESRPVAFFMVRDPRDVLISYVHYVTDMAVNNHRHEQFRSLHDHDTRLTTAIVGQPDWGLPPFGHALDRQLGWLDEPGIETIRFEDLVDNGPGFGQVAGHLRTRAPALRAHSQSDLAASLAQSARPDASATFRQGTVGGWREELGAHHLQLIEDIAGNQLERLGYAW